MFSTNIYAKKSERKCLIPQPERQKRNVGVWMECCGGLHRNNILKSGSVGLKYQKKNVFKGHVQLCGLFFVDIARQNKVNVEIPTSPPTEAFN